MHLDRPEKNKGTEGLPNRVARRQEAGHPGKGKELGFAGCWEGRQVRTGHLRKEFEVSLAGDVERLFPAQGYGGFGRRPQRQHRECGQGSRWVKSRPARQAGASATRQKREHGQVSGPLRGGGTRNQSQVTGTR